MQGFSLKESWADRFAGGSLARRDGTTFDVNAELVRTDHVVQTDDGEVQVKKGYIVADDDHDVALLNGFEPLKQVPVKEAVRAAKTSPAGDKKED